MRPASRDWVVLVFWLLWERHLVETAACPSGFVQYKAQCYHLGPEMRRNMTSDYCNCLGAHLTRPEDAEENWFMAALTTRHDYTWIGIEADSSGGLVWQWEDGHDVTWSVWGWSEPQSGGSYAVVDSSGFWHVRAPSEMHPAICETEAQTVPGTCLPRFLMVHDKRIRDHNLVTISDTNVTHCLEACQRESSFVCLSVDFSSTGQCVLSDADERTSNMGNEVGWDVFQWSCEECFMDLYSSASVLAAGGATFSASSQLRQGTPPESGQLFQQYQSALPDNAGVWAPDIVDTNQWWEVDYGLNVYADTVILQGINVVGSSGDLENHFLKSYHLLHSDTGLLWQYYTEEDGVAKVIPGNWEGNIPRAYRLKTPIIARYFRVNGVTWNTGQALRFAVFGCAQGDYVPADHGQPLGMEDHFIQDAQISASAWHTQDDVFYPAWAGRLNMAVNATGTHVGNCWMAPSNDQWIMVDLLVPHEISAVAVQGCQGAYVQEFHLYYSNDGDYGTDNFMPVENSESEMLVFDGTFGAEMAIQWPLSRPIMAHRIRLHPAQDMYVGNITLRMEVYGTPAVMDAIDISNIHVTQDQTNCACAAPSSTVWCSSSVPLQISLDYLYILTGIVIETTELDAINSVDVAVRTDIDSAAWETLEFNMSVVDSSGQISHNIKLERAHRAYDIKLTLVRDHDNTCATFSLLGTQASVCPPQYVLHQERCYWSSQDKITMVTQEEQEICRRTSWISPGYLITVNDPDEQHFLQLTNSPGNPWLGLFANETREPRENTSKPAWTWRWVDGSSYNGSYMCWDGDGETGQPDENEGEECAVLDSKMFHDYFCYGLHPYTCETPAAVPRQGGERCGWAGDYDYHLDFPDEKLIQNITASDINSCLTRCITPPNGECRSVNFKRLENVCNLLRCDENSDACALVASSGWNTLKYYCEEMDEIALVWGPQGVGAEYVSGNDFHGDMSPKLGVYGHPTSYYRAEDNHDVFQVNFRVKTKVTRLALQGSGRAGNCHISQYWLWASNNSVYWETVRELDTDGKLWYKTFLGPFDPIFPRMQIISPSLVAQFIRLEAVASVAHPCLRFEIYGTPMLPQEQADKGCAVEIMGYGGNSGCYYYDTSGIRQYIADCYITRSRLNINGYEFMGKNPTNALHLLQFYVDDRSCFTNTSVDVFEVTNIDELDRLEIYLSNLTNGSYLMGASVHNLGTSFHQLQDTFIDFGVDISAFTENYMSLAFVARKGSPDWAKSVWVMSIEGPSHIWRCIRPFEGDELAMAPLGMEAGDVLNSQIYSNYNDPLAPDFRGRLFSNNYISLVAHWYRYGAHYIGVDLGGVHTVTGFIVQGSGHAEAWSVWASLWSSMTGHYNSFGYSTNDQGTLLYYRLNTNPYRPVHVRLWQPVRGRFFQLSVLYYYHIYEALRFELLGYPEVLPEISLDSFTRVSSDTRSSGCSLDEMMFRVPGCSKWCPESGRVSIEIESLRWYQLSNLNIALSDMEDGDYSTVVVDVILHKNASLESLFSLPRKAYLETTSNASDQTIRFSPLLLTNNLVVDIRSENTYCLTIVLHGREAPACPPGMVQFGQRCYYPSKITGDKDINIYECSGLDWIQPSHLAHPVSRDVLQDIVLITGSINAAAVSVRVGLFKRPGGEWMWSNGTNATDIPWYGSVPTSDANPCAYVSSTGYLQAIPCTTNYHAVCETPAYVVPDATCQHQWQTRHDMHMDGDETTISLHPFGHYRLCFQLCTENPNCRSFIYYDNDQCYTRSYTRFNKTLSTWTYSVYFEKMCVGTHDVPLLQTFADTAMINITATSWTTSYIPSNAVLYKASLWLSSSTDWADVLTVKFSGKVIISAMAIQGGGGVLGYYSDAVIIMFNYWARPGWQTFSDPATGLPKETTHTPPSRASYGSPIMNIIGKKDTSLCADITQLQEFLANWEPHLRSIWAFPSPLTADAIDVLVRGYNGYYQNCRLEFYGHFVDGSDPEFYNDLGMESGHITDGQLASNQFYHDQAGHYSEFSVRLNSVAVDLYKVGWRAISLEDAWVRIDLHTPYSITGIFLEGSEDGTQWITAYKIEYKNEDEFQEYSDQSPTTMFSGPYGNTGTLRHSTYHELAPSLVTDVIKVIPVSYKASESIMRLELYGMPADVPSVADSQMTCGPSMAVCGAWCSAGGVWPTLYIDLVKYHHINGIALSSSVNMSNFTASVSYGVKEEEWYPVDFGSWIPNQNTSVMFSLLRHFNARYIRLQTTFDDPSDCLDVSVHGKQMTACPSNYIPFGDLCYVVHTVPTSYSDALRRCQRDGEAWLGDGQLAVVDSAEKLVLLGNLMKRSTGFSYVWMDGRWNASLQTVVYSDGRLADFMRWSDSPATDPAATHMAIDPVHHYFYNIDSAAAALPYMCQMNASGGSFVNLVWHYIPNVAQPGGNEWPVLEHTNKTECLHLCLRRYAQGCAALFYSEALQTCYHMYGNRYSPDILIVLDSQWEYFEIYMEGQCDAALLSRGFHKEIRSSSDLSPEYSASQAIYGVTPTGNNAGRWIPGQSQLGEYVVVEFPTIMTLTRITVGCGFTDPSQDCVTSFKFYKSDGSMWTLVLDASDQGEVFLGPEESGWMITHQLPTLPSSAAFKLEPVNWLNGITMDFELYGCNYEVPSTCFSTRNPLLAVLGQTEPRALNCYGDWVLILSRETTSSNPGLLAIDYINGFEEPTFSWFGTSPLYMVSMATHFNMRIDMWDEDDRFYFAEYTGVSVSDVSHGYELVIQEFMDGSHGDGGLITPGVEFTTTNTLSADDACSTVDTPVYGWWLYDSNCIQTVLTAPGLAKWLVQDEWYNTHELVEVDKVVMRLIEMDTTVVNLSQKKPTLQSSTVYGSELANDGNFDGDMGANFQCSQTQPGAEVWWRVDLVKVFPVELAVITGRSDCCHGELHDIDVLIGNTNITVDFEEGGYMLCGNMTGAYDGSSAIQIPCNPPISGQYVVIRMTGTAEVLTLCEVAVFAAVEERNGSLHDSCMWGQDCTVEFSACLPLDGSRTDSFTCQCRMYYQEYQDHCVPEADITLSGVSIHYPAEGIVRSVPYSTTVAFNISHVYGAPVPRVNESVTNVAMETILTDGSNVDSGYNVTTEFNMVTGFDRTTAVLPGRVIELEVTVAGTISAELCHLVSSICFVLIPGNSLAPHSYYEVNFTNNYACFVLPQLICKPEANIGVSSLTYESNIPMIRATQGLFLFTVDCEYMSGQYPVVELYDSYNFMAYYVYTQGPLYNWNTVDTSLYRVNITEVDGTARAGLAMGDTATLNLWVTTTMMLEKCHSVTHICFQILDHPLASFFESSLDDNTICHDITSIKICEPNITVTVIDVEPAPGSTITRGYWDYINILVTIENIDPNFDIPEATAPGQNFNATVKCSNAPARRKREVSAAIEVGPFIGTIEDGSLISGLPMQQSLILNITVAILLPRATCEDLHDLCVAVEPGIGATYSLASGGWHVNCIDLNSYKNCIGRDLVNVRFVPESVIVAERDDVLTFVSWSRGTDVSYTIDFQDGTTYDWQWDVDGHVLSYREHHTNVSHTFLNYNNFSLALNICSSVGCSEYTTELIVEPRLIEYIVAEVDYIPSPSPTSAAFYIQYDPILNFTIPVMTSCRLDFNDIYGTADVTLYGAIGPDILVARHTYTALRPGAICTILCWNHVSNVTFNVPVILQENITGLAVTQVADGDLSGSPSKIELSVINGSNMIFIIDYGDGSPLEIINNSQIYIHQEPFIADHIYVLAGNYTISVYTTNDHFKASTNSSRDVVIQNEVTNMTLSCDSYVEYPPGEVECTITPQAARVFPTDVFCEFYLRNVSSQRSYFFPALTDGSSVHHMIVADWSQMGPSIPVDVNCSNLASHQQMQTMTSLYETIRGLAVDMTNMGFVAAEAGQLFFSLENGTSVVFHIYFGDGTTSDFVHPLLYASQESLLVNHTYALIDNYTVTVIAYNPVSSLIQMIPEQVVVQNRILNLFITGSAHVLWPRENLTLTTTAGVNQQQLRNVHCNWILNDIPYGYMYYNSIDSGDVLVVSQPVLRQHIGLLNTTVTCQNLVSDTVENITTNVTLDAVILSDLYCNGSVWWQNASGFVLEVQRFAENSCFLWNMGGDNARFLYGLASCQTDAGRHGAEFRPIEDGMMTLVHNYTYKAFGVYAVEVYAYNDVSNHTLNTTAKVKEWVCFAPNITISPNDTTTINPMTKMRSEYFVIEVTLEVFCLHTWQRNDIWRIVNINTSVEILTLTDEITFVHYPRTLPTGFYEITYTTEMYNMSDTQSNITTYLVVTKSPLNVTIVGGSQIDIAFGVEHIINAINLTSDPDVEPGNLSGIAFSWECGIYNSSVLTTLMESRMDNFINMFPVNQTKRCKFQGTQMADSTDGLIGVNTGDMLPAILYEVNVTIRKDTRQASTTQYIYVQPIVAPRINITCRDNCDAKAALSRHVALKLTCISHCDNRFGGFHFKWSLYERGQTEPVANLSEITLNGVNGETIFLKEYGLSPGMTHTMVAEGWTPGSSIALTNYTFNVNQPLQGGQCTINPLSGTSANTLFVFDCSGWYEVNPVDPNFLLKYIFYVQHIGSDRLFPVFYGTESVSPGLVFPVGSTDFNFALRTIMRIFDSVDDAMEIVTNVTVGPPDEPGDEVFNGVLNGMSGSNSDLHRLLDNGETQEAATLVFSYISLINIPARMYQATSDPSLDINQLRRQTRTEVIATATAFEVDSLGSVLQNNEIMRTGLAVAEEVEVTALNSASDQLSRLTDLTGEFYENGEIYNPTLVSTDLVDTSIKVMIVSGTMLEMSHSQSNLSSEAGLPNETYSEVSNVMENVVGIIEDVSSILNEGMFVGDPPAVLEYDELTLVTSKIASDQLDNVKHRTSHGSIVLPPVGELLGHNTSSCLSNMVMFSDINPFIYGEQQTSAVGSSVVNFVLEDCHTFTNRRKRRRRREARNANSMQPLIPFSVSLVPAPLGEPVHVSQNVTSSDFPPYTTLDLAQPNIPVQIDVYPRPRNATMIVKIGLNIDPSFTEFNYSVRLDAGSSNASSDDLIVQDRASYTSIYIPASNLTNGTLLVAVTLPDCNPEVDLICPTEATPVPLVYKIRLLELTCQRWNDTEQLWGNDDCEMEGPITQTEAVFTSNLFGSLGVGIFPGPNEIDFNTVFNNPGQAILENLPVFCTVLLLLLLYIPLAIVCRKYDKRDELKWKVLPLVDMDRKAPCRYEVHVFTGFKKHSETDSSVHMVAIGTGGDTGVLCLEDGIRKNFGRGDINAFSFTTDDSLGGIYMMRIWHDNKGIGKMASWFLSKIVIVDVEHNSWYMFLCNQWLAADKDDGQLARVLRVSSKDSMNSGYLMQTNVHRKFYEDHLWLSVIYRQVFSSYTRVQRLGTAWALMYLTMIANAMWYKSADENQDDLVILSVGAISMTVYQLQVSIMGSLTVVPVVLFIMFCFKKAARKTHLDPNNSDPQATDTGTSKTDTSGSISVADFHDIDVLLKSSTGTLNVNHQEKKVVNKYKGPYKSGSWPYWVTYIAWAIVFLAVMASAFFTILYSFEWGSTKSTAWLVAFLLSFVEDVIIIEPIKVMLVAILLTLFFKEDTDMKPYEERYGAMKDAMDVFGGSRDGTCDNPWRHVDEAVHAAAQRYNRLEAHMLVLIKDIAHQVVFLVLILAVCYSNQDMHVFRQNESLRNTFLHKVHTVKNNNTFWAFLENTVLPGLYWVALPNGDSVSVFNQQFMADMNSYRLGQPRMRQLRVIQETCRVNTDMQEMVERCTKSYYHTYPPLDNRDYTPNWASPANSSQIDRLAPGMGRSFVYSTEDDINGASLWARLALLDGGGYVSVLGTQLDDAQSLVDNLINSNWLDQYTRAVLVEFSLLNANSNLFTMVTLAFEFPTFGGVFRYQAFETIKLYRYIGVGGILLLLLECLSFIFFISVLYKIIKRCIKEGREFALSLWGVSYLIMSVAFFGAVSMYTLRSVWTKSSLEEVMNNRDQGVGFSRLVMADSVFMSLMALVSFLAQLQLLYVLRYSRAINTMASTLLEAKGAMASLLLFALVAVMAFASMGHSLYGYMLEEYMTVWQSVKSLCVYVFGSFKMQAHSEVGGMAAKVFLLVYLLSSSIFLMDIFITLLNEFISEMKQDEGIPHPDEEVVNHLLASLSRLFGNNSDAESKKPEPSSEVNVEKDLEYYRSSRPGSSSGHRSEYRARLIKISD